MFESIEALSQKLEAARYILNPVELKTVYLACRMEKSIILEGPPGCGKTALANSIAEAAGTEMVRLQCYPGITADKAIGKFDEALQELFLKTRTKEVTEDWQTICGRLHSLEFFAPGPLMKAIIAEKRVVLLIDEVDKIDDEFEAFLLEILSEWLMSARERQRLGTAENFQRRYYRKDSTVINPASALWNAIPPDHDTATNWQANDGSLSPRKTNNPYEVDHQPRGLNPMFRFDGDRLLPYLHCEVDGNYIQLLMDELSLSITSFGIAYTFACFLLPPWLSIPLAALLALLIFLLQRWLDGGGDRGQADPVEVDFDDPDNFGEDGQQLDGDVVAVFGPWIMDTEHGQYLEIHPVKAYYVLGRNGRSGEISLFDSAADQRESGTERLHNGRVDPAMAQAACAAVNRAEGEDPGPILLRGASAVLSHGLTTKYGGVGFAAVD